MNTTRPVSISGSRVRRGVQFATRLSFELILIKR